MLLFISLLGIAFSVIILYSNGRSNRSVIYLGVFFFLISLYTFYQYVLLYAKSVILIKILLEGFIIFFPPLYLIGPMLFLYIRSVLTDDHRFKRSDHLHLIPMAIFFLAAIPYIFVPSAEKADAALEAARNTEYVSIYTATFLSDWLHPSAMYLIRPILVLAYTTWSVVLFSRYYFEKRISSVFSQQHFMTKWLCVLLSLVLILVVSQIIQIIRAFEMGFADDFFTLNILRIISIIGLVGLLSSPLFFPEILYGLPRVPDAGKSRIKDQGQSGSNKASGKKRSIHLESGYLKSIEKQTEAYMKGSRPYLHPDCNLTELSANLQIPAHHLGYYFREVRKESFTDFRNKWRIEHAKSLIMEGKLNELTLEAVALSCGFTNRNSFRTAFQRIEGMQPSDFASQFIN